MTATGDGRVVAVLAVCTGNVCRSPALQMMLRHGVGWRPGWEERGIRVTSRGTQALVGRQLEPRVRTNLVDLGVQVDDGFEARLLTAEVVGAADLVLCATRLHRAWLARAVPTAIPRTFTMLEFARFSRQFVSDGPIAPGGAADPAPRIRAVLDFAQHQRGRTVPPRPADDDVADPYGRSGRAYRRSVRQLSEVASAILHAVDA